MEYLIIAIVVLIILVILKVVFQINLKKIKEFGDKKYLDEMVEKYPSNVEICQEYLKKLKNEKVKIEEDKEANTTMYIAVSDKILIANLRNSYTRIQTIAHECLHSIQDRRVLLFNYGFSIFYILYFVMIIILTVLKIVFLPNLFLTILILLGFVYYFVRSYLENDVMIKARFLAKEYMEEKKISTPEEIKEIVDSYDELNHLGVPCVNYQIFSSVMIKVFIFCILCFFFR